MDIFDKDILSFWQSLQKNNVQYMVVGSYAVSLYGIEYINDDLDIWLNDTPGNRKAFRNTLVDCSMGDYPMIEQMRFIPNSTEFILHNGLRLDALTSMTGLEHQTFDDCLQLSPVTDIGGVSVPYLHIDQLIENKKSMNRAKDQVEIEALQEIRKSIEES